MQITNLPRLPKYKILDNGLLEIQNIYYKFLAEKDISQRERLLYKEFSEIVLLAIKQLKLINLSHLNKYKIRSLKSYLWRTLNFEFLTENPVQLKYVYRVSKIEDKFLINGKIRNTKYLSYPPLWLNRKNRVYNRANSPSSNVFYSSLQPNVAIRESKPAIGESIIISTWENYSLKQLNAYYINYHHKRKDKILTAIIPFSDKFADVGKWFTMIFDDYRNFLIEEFIKEIEHKSNLRHEYFFSAYFSERLLTKNKYNNYKRYYDLIIYPSVSWEHKHYNVAISPEIIDNNFKLVKANQYLVVDTFYDESIEINELPATLLLLRESKNIYNKKIIWSDD